MEFREEFEILEDDAEEKSAEKVDSQVRCWVGTWNNPKMTDEEFKTLLSSWLLDKILTYAIFQREKGEKTGIIHFQFFLNFRSAKRFSRLKKLLPYGCHFKPMRTTKTLCRNYCSKEETRVSGPYEIGEFVEERARTDRAKAFSLLAQGCSIKEINDAFENVVVDNLQKMEKYQIQQLKWKVSDLFRNIEVIYIYGQPGFGKTSFVYDLIGRNASDIYVVTRYSDKFMFSEYRGQKYILFDEFSGQIKPITYLNKLLEPAPIDLRIMNGTFPAMFERVYIVSNYSLKEIYKNEQEEIKTSYDAFCRRINKIYYFYAPDKYRIEKDTIFEDIPVEKQKFKGLTRQTKEVYVYDSVGRPTKIWDRYSFENVLVFDNKDEVALQPVEDDNMPF